MIDLQPESSWQMAVNKKCVLSWLKGLVLLGLVFFPILFKTWIKVELSNLSDTILEEIINISCE
jgi:hypothetical protein